MPRRAPLGRPSGHPLRELFLASGAAAVVVVIANTSHLALGQPVAFLRDLPLLRIVIGSPGKPRAEALTKVLSAAMPSLFNRPFEVNQIAGALALAATGLAVTLTIFWVTAIVLSPIVVFLQRTTDGGSPASRWFWGRAFPLGVFVTFASPVLLAPVHGLLKGNDLGMFLCTAALSALVWLIFVMLIRDSRRVARFVMVTSLGCGLVGLALLGSAFALAVRGERQRPPLAAGDRPNILFVSIDSLRADHLHSYGYRRETTPVIDALAREGALFRTVVSPSSWTLPTHLTLLTALPPEAHGVVDDSTVLRSDALFLSEVLWQQGYTTAGFVSAPYLDSFYGYSQGFDHYDDYTIAKRSFAASHEGITSPALVGIVTDWLKQWDAGGRTRPFFAFVHMWDVHLDYEPPPPYDTLFDPDYQGTMTGKNIDTNPAINKDMDPRDLQHLIALYDGEIRHTDAHLGLILDQLRKLGVLDDTIVVVTADHGEEFFEHGHKGHKKTLYDESILVPLVIRFPEKIPAGRVIGEQVRLMDIAPTVIALAGLNRPHAFGAAPNGTQVPAAQDLTSRIVATDGLAPPPLAAFCDLVGEAPVPLAALRTPTLKLIEPQEGRAPTELYDLVADPREQHPLNSTDAPTVTALARDLETWRQSWQSDRHFAQAANLSDEHKERLRALGYLGHDQ